MALAFDGILTDMVCNQKGQHGNNGGCTTSGSALIQGAGNLFVAAATGSNQEFSGTFRGVVELELIDNTGATAHKKTITKLVQGPNTHLFDMRLDLNATEGIDSETETTPGETYNVVYKVSEVNFGLAQGTQKPQVKVSYHGFFAAGVNNEILQLAINANFDNRLQSGSALIRSGGGVSEIVYDFDVLGP